MQQTRKIIFFLVSVMVLLSLVSTVFATDDDDVNLLDVPHQLGLRLGISDFAAGILASMILLIPCLLSVAVLARKDPFLPSMFVGFGVMGFCIAIAWLPYWFLLVISMMVAFMFADKIRSWITGRGG